MSENATPNEETQEGTTTEEGSPEAPQAPAPVEAPQQGGEGTEESGTPSGDETQADSENSETA